MRVAALAAALFAAQPAPADEIDAAFAAIAQAAADERALADTLERERQRLASAVLCLDAAAGGDAEAALQGEADAIDAALAQAYRDSDAVGAKRERLNRERALLQAWFDTFSRVGDSLGTRQFQALDAELAGMRRAGTIPANGPSALPDLRAVNERLRTLAAEAERLGRLDAAERERLHADIDGLQRRRDELALARQGAPLRLDDAALREWQDAAAAVAAAQARLEAVRDRIQALAEQVVALLGAAGPPYLAEVEAVAPDGPVYYHARWEADTGGNGDEALRARRLVAAERALVQALSEVAATRETLREPRQWLAERMAIESRIINEAAADWGASKENGIAVVALVDVVMTLAEAAAGNAPGALAGKTAELAGALRKMTGARMAANALLEAGPATAGTLAEKAARASSARREAMRATRAAFSMLVEEAIEAEVAKGTPRPLAALLAERRLLPVQEQVLDRLSTSWAGTSANAALADAQAGLLDAVQREAARAGLDITTILNDPTRFRAFADALLKEGVTGPGAKQAANEIGALYDAPLKRLLGADGEFVGHTAEAASVLLGDLVENGLKTVAYGAFGAEGISRAALAQLTNLDGGWTRFRTNVAAGYAANATGTLISAASTAVKSAAAYYFDQRTNAASDRFWDAFTASAVLQQRYNALIEDDKLLWGMQLRLRHALLAVQAELALLRGDRQKVVLVDQPVPAIDTRVELRFTFSTAVAVPPLLQNGSFHRPLQPQGTLPALTWSAPSIGCYLEDGQLSVALDPRTAPYPALDSDPAKPAYKEPGIPEPRHYEPGPDRNHVVKLAFAPGPGSGRHPLAGCWIGMGGYLVLQEDGSGWAGWIGHPDSRQELADIGLSAAGLEATMLFHDGTPQFHISLAAGADGRRLEGRWQRIDPPFNEPETVEASYVRQPWELRAGARQ